MPPERLRSSPPDLVLVHGWGMNTAVWDSLGPALSDRYRLHRLDLPGHGGGDYAAELRTLESWADALLDQAPPEAVWIGWSLGGSLALKAALTAPERVRGLCLVTATPRFTRAPDWPHAMPMGTLDHFHQALLADPQATLERFLALQVKGGEAPREQLRSLRGRLAEQPPAHPEALATGLGLLRETDLRAELAQLRSPNLWLFGERDTLVPAGCAGALPDLLGDARIACIPGAAHAPFLSHPDASLRLLEDFLENLI